MNKDKTKRDFLKIIDNYPKEIQHLAINLRALIFEINPETVEVAWVVQKVVGYGVGVKKMSEHFCYMVFAKKHITFGFNHGINLNDPKGILSGNGRKFRNVKIRSIDDINNHILINLIKDSIRERLKSLKK